MQSIEMSAAGAILLSLPPDLLGSFMGSFLSPHDVVRLDRSCCSRQTRQHFLEALQHNFNIKVLHARRSLPSLLKWIENRAIRVHNLTVQEFGEVELDSVDSVLDHIAEIELSTKRWATYAARIVSALSAKLAPKVRKITFNDNIAYDGDAFNPAWLDGSELRNLQELTCSVGAFYSEWTLRLIENNPHLHTLDVRCYNEDQAFFNRLSRSTSVRRLTVDLNRDGVVSVDSIIDRIASCYPNLEYLKITRLANFFRGPDLVTQSLVALAQKCPQLQEVHLDAMFTVNVSALTEFFATAHRLRAFNHLGTMSCFSDEMLLALAQSNGGAPHLEELGMRLSLTNDETIRQCGATLAHLRRCGEFAPNSAGYATAYACMRNLVDLQVSLQHLSLVADHCPAVRALTPVVNVQSTTDTTQNDLIRYLQLNPQLESLTIRVCLYSGELLTELLRHCSNLCTLTATAPIFGVTSADLVDLARHCPRLVTLNLPNVDSSIVTDEVLTALADHCHYLEELCLPPLAHNSHRGLIALVASCKRLRVVRFRGSQSMPNALRRTLRIQARQRGRLLQFSDEMRYKGATRRRLYNVL